MNGAWATRWQSAAFERRGAADKRYHVFIDGFVRGEDLKRNLLRHHKMDESVGPYTAGLRCSLLDSDVSVGPLGFRRQNERDIDAASRLILCVGGSATFGMTVEPSEGYRKQVLQLTDLIESAEATPVLVAFAIPFTMESDDATFAYFDVMQNGHGSARAACKLVETHNRVLREIAAQNELLCVDQAAELNGHDQFFIDTCHFTQAGRQRVAERLVPPLGSILANRLEAERAIAVYPADPGQAAPMD